MATARDTETTEDTATLKAEPYDMEEEWRAYIDSRLRSLTIRVDTQEDKHRRLVLMLVIVAYALVFGYLVGRDTHA